MTSAYTHLPMSIPLMYALCGLIVGALVGLTGVGGGSVMTPILVLLFGLSPGVAVGTDLVFSSSTKLVATASFGFSRRVDWRIVARLAVGSVPASTMVLLWFWLDHRAPNVLDQLISRCLSVILLCAAVALLLQNSLRRWGLKFAAAWFVGTERHTVLLTVATGALLGLGVTMTSVGAGALGVAALVALYPLRLPTDRLVATDIAHALPLTAIAAGGHAVLGHIDLRALACLLVGSIPGVLIASRATILFPPRLTRTLIALTLGMVSIRMFLG